MSESAAKRSFFPLILLVILMGCSWGFLYLAALRKALPRCFLRMHTGIPCPFCSGAHSFLAWAQFDWVKSFHYNPLVFLTSLGICVYFGIWIVSLILKKPSLGVMPPLLRKRFVPILFAVLFLNWLYLVWMFGRW
jgi:hypothetical protein